MGRINLCILTDRRHTMTGVTASSGGHGTMIKRCRDKAAGGMTGTTIRRRHNMTIDFTLGEQTIVAGLTVIHDASMIKATGYKARGQVTHAAIIAGRYMVAMFSCGDNAIMTSNTVVHDACVIKTGTGKGHGVMTYRAILAGRKMVYRLHCYRRYTAIVTR